MSLKKNYRRSSFLTCNYKDTTFAVPDHYFFTTFFYDATHQQLRYYYSFHHSVECFIWARQYQKLRIALKISSAENVSCYAVCQDDLKRPLVEQPIKPFIPNALFLYPRKKQVEKECIGNEWVNHCFYACLYYAFIPPTQRPVAALTQSFPMHPLLLPENIRKP